MSNHANQNQSRIYKIYMLHEKQRVEVTKEQYYGYYRDVWATRKRAQSHGQCMCPKSKLWLCDGDCLICKFRAPGDSLSLDLTHENENGEEYSLLDELADQSASIDDVVTDQIMLDILFQCLGEIMPEARCIGDLRLAGLSDAEIAAEIGIPRTTFLYRLKKAKELLQNEYPDLF